MDTKLKNNRKKIILLSFCVITMISAIIVSWYPQIDKKISTRANDRVYKDEELIRELSKNNYLLLKKAMEDRMQKKMTVREIFFSDVQQNNDYESTWEIDRLFEEWYENRLVNLHYYILDHQKNVSDTNTNNNLDALMTSGLEDNHELLDIYDFCIKISYNKKGKMKVNYTYGTDFELISNFMEKYTLMSLVENVILRDGEEINVPYMEEKTPEDFTIIYAIPKKLEHWDEILSFAFSARYYGYADSEVILLFIGAMLFTAIFAILLGGRKTWYKENGFLARIPLELNAVLLFGVLLFVLDSNEVINTIKNSGFMNKDTYTGEPIVGIFNVCLVFGANLLMWISILGSIFISVSSLKQIVTMGPINYLKKRTILGFLMRTIKKFIISLSQIDLTEKSNKILLKIILFHYVIMAIISCTWFLGIFLFIPYSIFIYFLLRKYFLDLKEKYATLLKATSKMAEGNLNVDITNDLGVFETLKMELEQIQTGFRKAVEEEVKSQKMKTELITNVSHDLKTPLTAIITYIDLLKGEQITEEERKSYIDTLDRKSQRLKTLIEDLFEVSKADSKNVKLDIVDVDVIALMKQTQFELQNKIEELGLEFRWNVPKGKIILPLDSQKTFRIFENLMNNTVKYSLPDSRVYIDVETQNQEVIIALKNISKEELNIGAEEITERFIRGDRSRNTEGSGLGLSIVKSFVELQGGTFQIVIDGDLFKAIIQFNLTHKVELRL